MKGITRALLAAVVTLLILTFGQARGEVLMYSVELSAESYKIDTLPDGQVRLAMPDFVCSGVPGKPALPSRVFMIALPPGAEVVSLDASGTPRELEGTFRVVAAPLQLPKTSPGELEARLVRAYNETLAAAYRSDEPFPATSVASQGMGNLRKWRLAYVRFTPFQYRARSGRLAFVERTRVTLHYSVPAEGSEAWRKAHQAMDDTIADARAAELLVNYQDALRWYAPAGVRRPRGCLLGKQLGSDAIGYCVIVPNLSFLSAVYEFMCWKATTLAPDTIMCVSADTIEAYYPGRDRPEATRNFLFDCLGLGLRYVLLVGDVWDMPMRECWPDPNNHTPDPNGYENPVPTDFYYADVTGDWDSDGDGYFGEMGQDAVDFLAEFSVGRILSSNPATVQQVCSRIKRFEQNTDPWKRNALMLGSVTTTSNNPPVTDEARIMEAITDSLLIPEGWPHLRLYEQDGYDPSPIPCDDSLREDLSVFYWSYYPFGYVNWSGHGNPQGAYRTINVGGGQDSQPPIFHYSDIGSLNDEFPSVVFSSACLTAKPEGANLGEGLIEHGAAAFIGATRGVYGPVGEINWSSGGNTSYNCYFALALMRYAEKVGDALSYSKYDYWTRHWQNWTDWVNLFAFNLYGDPALIWQGHTGIAEQSALNVGRDLSLLVFPIPVRQQATVRFTLPADSRISVKILDESGRLLRVLCDTRQKAGTYTLTWDGRSDRATRARAGVYFCRLQAGDFTATRKIVKAE
jgi:hypothetical protein